MLRVSGWACVLLAAACCRAQQEQTPVFTLKVYANLVQVPALVLDHDKQPLPRIDPARFRVSLDEGKKFAPTRVRVEGEDPLDVAILLDMSGSQRRLIASFADVLAKLSAGSLHPQDRVSVYALNCHLIRSALQIAPQAQLLSKSVTEALSAPTLNEGYSHGACAKPSSLWTAMMAVVSDMSDSPARRVMLVISEGDRSGFGSSDDLHFYAAAQGVALFGMNDGFDYTYDPLRRSRNDPFGSTRHDPFRSLCESTGGLVMDSEARRLEKHLGEWITLLRNRYVVEFPRPQQLSPGTHDIQISIKGDALAFVSFAGVSVSLPDPKLTSDPNYLPSTAGADIPVGKRRPMTK